MKNAEAVVFDFNGTLYFDYRENRDAWDEIYMKYRGRHFTTPEYDSMMGMTDYNCVRKILGDDTAENILSSVSREKEEKYLSLCTERSIKIEKDAEEFILRLKNDGIKVLIASSCPKMNMEWYIENAGIKDLFERKYIIAGREDIPSKPAPDIFRLTLRTAGVEPENAICFEDSPNGLRAALKTPFRKVYSISSPGFDDSEQKRLASVVTWRDILNNYDKVIKL